jgi:hypothetical protein
VSSAIALLSLWLSPPALAFDYQVHGYASQGFVLSSGNNVFGESTKGSINYYEAALNGTLAPAPQLMVSAQEAIRDAGATDTGVPRLDYWLADYRPLSTRDGDLGLRIGKVKNPIGFFNDTRDEVFARPGILMPGVYDEEQGARNLLFAAPGAQLYGDAVWRNHSISLVGTWTRNRQLPASQKQLLIMGLDNIPYDVPVSHSWNARLVDSIDAGRIVLAYSHFYTRFDVVTSPATQIYANVDTRIEVFSARYNASRWDLIAEYAMYPQRTFLSVPNPVPPPSTQSQLSRQVGDSGYLQADYRIDSHWTTSIRFDATFGDQSDRSGREFANANPGSEPAALFAYDGMAAVNWRYSRRLGLWAEFHRFYGFATIQSLDNQGRVPADHWSLFMLMIDYQV